VGIPNEFFGGMVDVSGLVTGGDLIARMQKEEKRARILIPDVMLRHGETVFLDDVSIQDAENKLGMKIDVLKVDGGEFLDAFITGGQNG
jgi:NifB/MoaA-like Fe-S oxidoreductase